MTNADVREELASWAEKQAADRVAELPKGSNDGPPLRLYGLSGEAALPWCARMVRTGLLLVDDAVRSAAPRERYAMGGAAYLFEWLTAHGGVVVGWNRAARGDLRFLTTRGQSDAQSVSEALLTATQGRIHHVGVVAHALEEGGRLLVVDGNWNDAVETHVVDAGEDDAIYVRYPGG